MKQVEMTIHIQHCINQASFFEFDRKRERERERERERAILNRWIHFTVVRKRDTAILYCSIYWITFHPPGSLKEKSDRRDRRPLVYHGTFVLPSPLLNLKKNPFYGCELLVRGRTSEVDQLCSKFMREVEDMAENALPPSSDDREAHLHGARKYAQLGTEAWEAVLSGLLTTTDTATASLTCQSCLLVLDLHPQVGDCLDAVLKLRTTFPSRLWLSPLGGLSDAYLRPGRSQGQFGGEWLSSSSLTFHDLC